MKALIIIGCIALYLVCCAASMCIIISGKKLVCKALLLVWLAARRTNHEN